MRKKASAPLKARLGKSRLRTCLRWIGVGVAGLWLLAAVLLVGARWIDPPATAVHLGWRTHEREPVRCPLASTSDLAIPGARMAGRRGYVAFM